MEQCLKLSGVKVDAELAIPSTNNNPDYRKRTDLIITPVKGVNERVLVELKRVRHNAVVYGRDNLDKLSLNSWLPSHYTLADEHLKNLDDEGIRKLPIRENLQKFYYNKKSVEGVEGYAEEQVLNKYLPELKKMDDMKGVKWHVFTVVHVGNRTLLVKKVKEEK
jgi:hypothetical protein